MIAIIGVAGEEIGYFKSMTVIESEHRFAGMDFYKGTLQGTDVVLVCSQIGKIPVAVTTQIAIDRFDVDAVIASGPAGPLVPYLQQGDMVIADRLIQYEPKYSTAPESEKSAFSGDSLIHADPGMITRVTEAYEHVFAGKSNRPQMVMGTVVSSDSPFSNRKTIGRLQRDYGVVAVDIDGATSARVCQINEKPFLLIRTVVDSPDGDFYNNFDSQLQVVPEYITALVSSLIAAPEPAPVM